MQTWSSSGASTPARREATSPSWIALASRTVAAAVSAEAGPEEARNPDRARNETSAKARAAANEFLKDITSRYRLLWRLVPSIRRSRYQWSAPCEVRHSRASLY